MTEHKGLTMTSKVLFPSLSEDGWVSSSTKVADYLFSHFFISDYSQTYVYDKQVSSMPWIIQKNQGDMTQTLSDMQATLSIYFSRYFNNVVVEAKDITDANFPSKGIISLYIKFTDQENKDQVFGKLLEISNMTISKIVAINNG